MEIALIDGQSSLETIFDLSPMTESEVVALVESLLLGGVIALLRPR